MLSRPARRTAARRVAQPHHALSYHVGRGPWSVGPLSQYRVSFRGSERLLTHKIPRDAARARGHVLGPVSRKQ